MKVYVDGALVGSQAATGTIVSTTTPVLLGALNINGTVGDFLAGKLDEPAIYSRALTGGEIQGIYAAGARGKPNAIGNGGDGVYITGAPATTIGGNSAGAGNVISDNTGSGVRIYAASYNVVAGNYIGTDATGLVAVPNFSSGVILDFGGVNNTIGGGSVAERNIISGNHDNGIFLHGGTGDRVSGNYIGTDATGNAALPNQSGIDIGGTGYLVGTDGDGVNDAAERNVISGNLDYGVLLNGGFDTKVAGNYIGVNAAGDTRLSNGFASVATFYSTGNIIGTDGSNDAFNAHERNVIDAAVLLGNANVFAGNYVGLNAAGTAALAASPDFELGIQIAGTTGTRVGTNGDGIADVEERNVIAGRNGPAILVSEPRAIIAGNYIGTDYTGNVALPNVKGIELNGAAIGVRIGVKISDANAAAEGNVISGNTENGVIVDGSSGVLIAGNTIGMNASGTAALANGQDGVVLRNGAITTTIGGNSSLARNIISGNSGAGVSLYNAATTGNLIAGNYIGVGADGKTPRPNTPRRERHRRARKPDRWRRDCRFRQRDLGQRRGNLHRPEQSHRHEGLRQHHRPRRHGQPSRGEHRRRRLDQRRP